MKKKYTEFILALVSVLCASALMCGCGIIIVNSPATVKGETEESSDETSSYEVAEYEPHRSDTAVMARRYLKSIKKKDYDGSVFLITSAKEGLAAPDENSGAVISSKLLERNENLGNYFNLSISAKTAKPEDMLTDISANVKSGTYFSDIIFIPQAYIYQFMVHGYLTNLASMPSLDLKAEYFYSSSAEAAGAAGKTYALAGPATITEDSLSCVFFNKALLKAAGLKSPYELVDNGTWTWDEFGKYLKSATDLNKYSFGTQNAQIYFADLMYFSCGGKFTNAVEGGYPMVAMDKDFGTKITQKAASLLADPKYYSDSMSAIERFNSGEMMFLIDNLSTAYTLANSSVDWGILPLPKYDAKQKEYISYVNPEEAMFMAVVPTVTDTDKVSRVMSVMNIFAYGNMADNYIENAMNYALRDNTSCKMMSHVFKNPVYDFAYTFSPYNQAIANISYTAVRNPASGFHTVPYYIDNWTYSFNNCVRWLFR